MGLIVIEGLDGSGKSTQINRLNSYLTARGYCCHQLHFPQTDSPVYGDLIARFLRGELGDIQTVNPYLVALIYAGDRLNLKSTLNTWLNRGDMVLLDRYVYSNVAYQCAKMSCREDAEILRRWILNLEFEYHALPKPDLNIFLDVPFDFTRKKLTDNREGDERNYLCGRRDIHESSLDFQKTVRNMYLAMTDADGFVQIDCSNGHDILSVDEVFSKIINVLKEQLTNI